MTLSLLFHIAYPRTLYGQPCTANIDKTRGPEVQEVVTAYSHLNLRANYLKTYGLVLEFR
jgi:hypothetical protein